MDDWRDSTPDERELLRVILLADFPEREILRGCLVRSRVRPSCLCGCGSVEFESAVPDALPGDWEFELDALTRTGARAAVALRRRGLGQPVFQEITRLADSEPVVEIVPESLRQSDVARVERGVTYRVPRQMTVVEEASPRRH